MRSDLVIRSPTKVSYVPWTIYETSAQCITTPVLNSCSPMTIMRRDRNVIAMSKINELVWLALECICFLPTKRFIEILSKAIIDRSFIALLTSPTLCAKILDVLHSIEWQDDRKRSGNARGRLRLWCILRPYPSGTGENHK